jgi:hypothetical protein
MRGQHWGLVSRPTLASSAFFACNEESTLTCRNYIACTKAKLTTTELVGAGIAVTVLIFGVAFGLIYLIRRRRSRSREKGSMAEKGKVGSKEKEKELKKEKGKQIGDNGGKASGKARGKSEAETSSDSESDSDSDSDTDSKDGPASDEERSGKTKKHGQGTGPSESSGSSKQPVQDGEAGPTHPVERKRSEPPPYVVDPSAQKSLAAEPTSRRPSQANQPGARTVTGAGSSQGPVQIDEKTAKSASGSDSKVIPQAPASKSKPTSPSGDGTDSNDDDDTDSDDDDDDEDDDDTDTDTDSNSDPDSDSDSEDSEDDSDDSNDDHESPRTTTAASTTQPTNAGPTQASSSDARSVPIATPVTHPQDRRPSEKSISSHGSPKDTTPIRDLRPANPDPMPQLKQQGSYSGRQVQQQPPRPSRGSGNTNLHVEAVSSGHERGLSQPVRPPPPAATMPLNVRSRQSVVGPNSQPHAYLSRKQSMMGNPRGLSPKPGPGQTNDRMSYAAAASTLGLDAPPGQRQMARRQPSASGGGSGGASGSRAVPQRRGALEPGSSDGAGGSQGGRRPSAEGRGGNMI